MIDLRFLCKGLDRGAGAELRKRVAVLRLTLRCAGVSPGPAPGVDLKPEDFEGQKLIPCKMMM